MDYQEAIETVQDIHDVAEARIKIGDARGVIYITPDKLEDVKTAISALQELQLYKDGKLCLISESVYSKQCDELDAYKQIGTLEEVQEAVEKHRCKKIEIWNGQATCPQCKKLFGNISDIKRLISWEMPYCKFCGQHLDWSEEE